MRFATGGWRSAAHKCIRICAQWHIGISDQQEDRTAEGLANTTQELAFRAHARLADSNSVWVVNPSGLRRSGDYVDDTLRLRVAEQGLASRLHLAGDFPRQRVEVIRATDGWAEVNERFYRRGWTDGLPIVPPTLERVSEFVNVYGKGRDHLLATMEPLGGLATVEKVAWAMDGSD